MSHKPISFHNTGLSFPQKVCFEGLTTQIQYGNRIAIMGQNGCGKSTLLKMLQGLVEPNEGDIHVPYDVVFGYVPQVIEEFESLSGGQRLNEALTQALVLDPNVLLLDEPTNHLDLRNRRSLMRLLQTYPGTLIVASHDVELLRSCIDTLWHIESGKVHIFSGNYDDYMQEFDIKRASVEQELSNLNRQKKETHHALMKEQTRAKISRAKGEKHIEQRKWPTIVSDAKARQAVETSGCKKSAISHKKQELVDRLSELRLPEIIKPKFSLTASDIGLKDLVSIREGLCGYKEPILKDITLSVGSMERIAIMGDNGSGKTTLIKAILDDATITKSGSWLMPKREDIGYLDQHYNTLNSQKTVLEVIHDLIPTWSHADIRSHLNDFLLRKNEEINAPVHTLSGGEKARLSLAQIAAKTPKLLILDEITNNLDLETREHVIQVLTDYPGAMIVISHDEDFLKAIKVTHFYNINQVLENE
ncbi:MAG TPA: ABC-F family ATP-binding cassette domain-containing protein [Alphaproteobacteria bacterium]|nr:ABC-F family ATP-binding cassette domain-containing protein [Alphaproteobacteria bacterium]